MTAAAMRVTRRQEVEAPDLPQKIQQAREAKGLSIVKLRQLSGISRVSLTEYEKGTAKTISHETLKKLERVLGADFGINFGE